jgi:6-phosphogluconolactonase
MMNSKNWRQSIQAFDTRRDLIVPGDHQSTLQFCTDHFLMIGHEAIEDHGYFAVALSGGSTPKAIYQSLADPLHRTKLDWGRVWLFWSDERSVPPYDPESNYYMAINAGFGNLPIPPQNIHRMQAEGDIEQGALAYEKLIRSKLPDTRFDLVMLGMGEDGHTASLFPKTHGLHAEERLVIANYIPQKSTWRMTLTFECINAGRDIAIYVMGKSKREMVKHIFTGPYEPDELPIQRVGTPEHKALWILDQEAFTNIAAV